VSHALRHEPWLYELELDSEGWVAVEQLLGALRLERPDWADISADDLSSMIERSPKPRHEMSGDRIRAVYGHSIPGRVSYRPANPPAVLFHGTAPEAAAVVMAEGLRPMGRQYVHLSVDAEMAMRVGARKSSAPVILMAQAADACRAGVAFYQASAQVWLADHVPAAYLSRT